MTGATGQVAYALLPRIAAGEMFGPETEVDLASSDIPPMVERPGRRDGAGGLCLPAPGAPDRHRRPLLIHFRTPTGSSWSVPCRAAPGWSAATSSGRTARSSSTRARPSRRHRSAVRASRSSSRQPLQHEPPHHRPARRRRDPSPADRWSGAHDVSIRAARRSLLRRQGPAARQGRQEPRDLGQATRAPTPPRRCTKHDGRAASPRTSVVGRPRLARGPTSSRTVQTPRRHAIIAAPRHASKRNSCSRPRRAIVDHVKSLVQPDSRPAPGSAPR